MNVWWYFAWSLSCVLFLEWVQANDSISRYKQLSDVKPKLYDGRRKHLSVRKLRQLKKLEEELSIKRDHRETPILKDQIRIKYPSSALRRNLICPPCAKCPVCAVCGDNKIVAAGQTTKAPNLNSVSTAPTTTKRDATLLDNKTPGNVAVAAPTSTTPPAASTIPNVAATAPPTVAAPTSKSTSADSDNAASTTVADPIAAATSLPSSPVKPIFCIPRPTTAKPVTTRRPTRKSRTTKRPEGLLASVRSFGSGLGFGDSGKGFGSGFGFGDRTNGFGSGLGSGFGFGDKSRKGFGSGLGSGFGSGFSFGNFGKSSRDRGSSGFTPVKTYFNSMQQVRQMRKEIAQKLVDPFGVNPFITPRKRPSSSGRDSVVGLNSGKGRSRVSGNDNGSGNSIVRGSSDKSVGSPKDGNDMKDVTCNKVIKLNPSGTVYICME